MSIIYRNLWFYTGLSDGQRILSCGADHFMRVLDVHTGTEVYSKDVGEEIRCVGRFYNLLLPVSDIIKNQDCSTTTTTATTAATTLLTCLVK